ncbi:MAG: hypothetical protein ACXAB7_08850 [Candidatus Kariarchaeaceae archaeon]|jgi:hypothetical protein
MILYFEKKGINEEIEELKELKKLISKDYIIQEVKVTKIEKSIPLLKVHLNNRLIIDVGLVVEGSKAD